MKILLSLLMVLNFNIALADCDFSKEILKRPDGYLYSTGCHKRVGKTVRDLIDAEREIEKLRESIDQKNIALQKSDEQLMMWRAETYEQHKRLMNVKTMSEREKWIWFGIGILVMGGAVYGAGQLR